MMRNLLSTLITSTGVPMLAAGDETARTQRGNNNAYCIDDETTWVDWSWVTAARTDPAYDDWRLDLLSWTRALLQLRRSHPVLGRDVFFDGHPIGDEGLKDLAWFSPDGQEMTDSAWFDHDRRVIGGFVTNPDPDGESLVILANTGADEAPFLLPGLPWASSYRRLLDTTDETPSEAAVTDAAGSKIRLTPQSMAIYAARR
jgi:glycogen operon protein